MIVCLLTAVAQLTDKMDPMYVIPKVLSEPHDEAHVIFFLCFQFWPPGAKIPAFLALAQLTDKMDPVHIILK